MNSRIFLKKDSVSTANDPKENVISELTPNATDVRGDVSSNYTNQSALNLVIGGTKLPVQEESQIADDEKMLLKFSLNEESVNQPPPLFHHDHE
jgi:hypothetical protein